MTQLTNNFAPTRAYLDALRAEFGTTKYTYTSMSDRPIYAYEYNEITDEWISVLDLELKQWQLKNLNKEIAREMES